MLDEALDFDPLNFALLYERYQIAGEAPIEGMQGQMQDVENNYIEIATHYMNAGLYDDVIRLFDRGAVKPQIDSVFSFEEAPAAHRRMQNRENIGKIFQLKSNQPKKSSGRKTHISLWDIFE